MQGPCGQRHLRAQEHRPEPASDAARRPTNLFTPSAPIVVADAVLDRGLVHRTERGELVRSKSEVIIANILHQMNLVYEYEAGSTGADGRTVRPDFTIITDGRDGVDSVAWRQRAAKAIGI